MSKIRACPRCGGRSYAEDLAMGVMSKPIEGVEGGGLEYGKLEVIDCEIEGYRCVSCGNLAKDSRGRMIRTDVQFAKWLTEKGV